MTDGGTKGHLGGVLLGARPCSRPLRLRRQRASRRRAPRLREGPGRRAAAAGRPAPAGKASCSVAAGTPTRSRSRTSAATRSSSTSGPPGAGPAASSSRPSSGCRPRYGKRVAFLGVDSEDSDDAARTFLSGNPGALPELHRPRRRDHRQPRRPARPSRHRLLRQRAGSSSTSNRASTSTKTNCGPTSSAVRSQKSCESG